MAGALIITAELAQDDFSWIEGLRRAHYPRERNQVRAHLTMFHALPPSAEGEVRARLAQIVRRPAPIAMIAGLMDAHLRSGGIILAATHGPLGIAAKELQIGSDA